MPSVLLVADDDWVYNDVVSALSDPDTELDYITDPKAVAERVVESQPDVAVIDLQVGTMGGMALARSIREAHALDGAPDIPVVLLLDRAADSFLAKRSAAAAWVKKPFTAADLREAVAKALASA